MGSRRLTALMAGVLALPGTLPGAAGETVVRLGPAGAAGAYRVEGHFQVAAPPELAWKVLTDYDHIGRFVSSIRLSRVLSREGDRALLRQEASGRFFVFTRRVRVTLDVREHYPGRIDFEDVDRSQFADYQGSWRLAPGAGGTTVAYELTARPRPGMGPGFALRSALRKNAAGLLSEVQAEILRRAAAGR